MEKFIEKFGSKVFDINIMKEKLPSPIFKKWKEAASKQDALDRVTADAIAHAMKEWALSQGCTHYTHWFQPLTGVTAEKHDAFIDKKDGEPILKFSGKSLIKGEPDASSFPNGGLRATFEARGYTYWDCTSPAFIRDNILCIPTVFVSFNGEALDTKEPLLKSVDAISKEATRIVNIFGDKDVVSVTPSVGLEQEYFLVDRQDFLKRSDLVLCGTTLLGTLPPKGQELESHYFGSIPSRVKEFMQDINDQLWELGVYAKSEHNEVAPGQFELASIFADVNIAIDQNQIIMDILQKTAIKHEMICLLHEKPFKGVNGSGKHNNWSLITNTGLNLLDPGKNPHENIQFLTFLCAIIKAVDEHPELVRFSSSGPGNDYRLGANEAPPAIVSIFLGSQVSDVLNQLLNGKPKTYEKNSLNEFGISSLSYLPRDNSDRNRTSPVAFTGNKFEFRMLGSSLNAANLNIVINTIVANALHDIANKLEDHKYRQDIRKAALDICIDIIKKHNRVLFDGDGYSKAWVKEAETRGLPNIKTYYEAVSSLEKPESIALFEKFKVLSKEEIEARVEVSYESYFKIKDIECKALLSMVRKEAMPILENEVIRLSNSELKASNYVKELIKTFLSTIDQLDVSCKSLMNVLVKADSKETYKEKGLVILKEALPLKDHIRELYDSVEGLISKEAFTYPTYGSLFFKIDF